MEEKVVTNSEIVFSEELLRFLFVIVDEKDPFGLFLKKLEDCDGEQIAQQAQNDGVEQGIFCDGEPTEKGLVLLRILDEYKNAKLYCNINSIRAAVLPGELMILFYYDKGVYHMSVMKSSEFLQSFLAQYPELLEKEEEQVVTKSQKKEFSAWLEEMQSFEGNLLTIGSYQKDGDAREEIFYWKNNGIYRYQMKNEREKVIKKEQILQRLRQVCIPEEEGYV